MAKLILLMRVFVCRCGSECNLCSCVQKRSYFVLARGFNNFWQIYFCQTQ